MWTYKVDVEFEGGVSSKAICSVWVPTDEERQAIADGENIRLIVFMDGQPPVSIDLTDERIMGVDRS